MKPSFIDRFVSAALLSLSLSLWRGFSAVLMRTFPASLYQAPWKTLAEGPTFPGFFLGKIFVYGYPSDTFVKLPVSEMKPF